MLATLLDLAGRWGLLVPWALGGALALSLSACEPSRPPGRYKGPDLFPPDLDASGTAAMEDAAVVLPPDAGEPGPDPEPDGGQSGMDAGEPGEPLNPLAAIEGDYLMRFDTVTKSNQENLGSVTTTTVAYGVMRVTGADSGALSGTEWLCHSRSNQTATKGEVTTTIADVVWPRLAPVPRTLEVDLEARTWTSGPGTRRQGWVSTASEMPRDVVDQEDLFLNPDGDYFGVNIRLQGTGRVGALPASFDCSYDVVSYSTTRYVQATLGDDGLLATAQVQVDGSEVFALRANTLGAAPCNVSDLNDAEPSTTPTDEVTLSRFSGTWLPSSEADPTPCPSASEFEGALP